MLIEFPNKLYDICNDDTIEAVEQMFNALQNQYIRNKKPTPVPYWYDKVNDDIIFNRVLKYLSKQGIITVTVKPARHWAEMQLNEDYLLSIHSQEDINDIRLANKYRKYKLTSNIKSEQSDNIVKVNGEFKQTGLVRKGFAKAGTNKFKYDLNYLIKYKLEIIHEVTKTMRKLLDKYPNYYDEVDYSDASISVVESIIAENGTYTTGTNFIDSRGRAISSATSKVFNPITYKEARSLLIMEPAEHIPFNRKDEARRNVYLFIAELHGIKTALNEDSKAKKGKKFYDKRILPDITDDLHEYIWLERLYDELDRMNSTIGNFDWVVPIEADQGAAMLQGIAALTNDKHLATMTNMIGKRISDPWNIDNVPRLFVKDVLTPTLYGSSESPTNLLRHRKRQFTRDHVKAITKEYRKGKYGVAKAMKDFVIGNVKPKPIMNIKLWDNEFTIECNKFRNVGDYVVRYNIYDTHTDMVLTIYHTHTKRVPDLQRFTLYFETLLLHGIDSIVMDYICENISWIIPIHDATVTGPLTVTNVRKFYANKMEDLNRNRTKILKDYFKSIGIKGNGKWKLFEDTVLSLATPIKSFKVQPTAMK